LRRFTKKVAQLIEQYGTPVSFKEGLPVFKAVQINPYQMAFYCPRCYRWQIHGIDPIGEIHHRSTHCSTYTPTNTRYENGYFLFFGGEEKKL